MSSENMLSEHYTKKDKQEVNGDDYSAYEEYKIGIIAHL